MNDLIQEFNWFMETCPLRQTQGSKNYCGQEGNTRCEKNSCGHYYTYVTTLQPFLEYKEFFENGHRICK